MSLLAMTVVLPAAAVLTTTATAKDRPITDQERPKLEAALKEAGCSGGKMEFDDDKTAAHPNGKFEVDDATCQDGKKYDLTFDPNFKVLTKKAD
ncbi:MAG: PepSY domain-containing protein [Reyranella sp.]|nr:PepSY domain-containing protein [Reyranella sp.]